MQINTALHNCREKSIKSMVVKIKICILKFLVEMCEWLFPEKWRKIFFLHRASKYDKGDGSSTAPFMQSKFQLLSSSEQLSRVVIISIINKCSLLI